MELILSILLIFLIHKLGQRYKANHPEPVATSQTELVPTEEMIETEYKVLLNTIEMLGKCSSEFSNDFIEFVICNNNHVAVALKLRGFQKKLDWLKSFPDTCIYMLEKRGINQSDFENFVDMLHMCQDKLGVDVWQTEFQHPIKHRNHIQPLFSVIKKRLIHIEKTTYLLNEDKPNPSISIFHKP